MFVYMNTYVCISMHALLAAQVQVQLDASGYDVVIFSLCSLSLSSCPQSGI